MKFIHIEGKLNDTHEKILQHLEMGENKLVITKFAKELNINISSLYHNLKYLIDKNYVTKERKSIRGGGRFGIRNYVIITRLK